jgi:glutamate synthase (NADPH/NADH) small chain
VHGVGEGADIRGGRLPAAAYDENFADLQPPLARQEAVVEAARCYFCYDAPCVQACPTGIDIPSFIRKIQTGNLKGSALDILEANIMGGTCARVCPTEVLCEEACVRTVQEGKPVRIGRLQRYATDALFATGIQPFSRAASTGRRIAVVGAGPAGLACAHALARRGHDVVVFERRAKAGGLNEHGIAAYKMANDFAAREVAFILGIGGIELHLGQALGRELTLDALRRDHDAVFLGVGLGTTNRLGLAGEELEGVLDAVDFIEELRQSPDKATLPVGRHIVVIGGGNTAIDIAVQTKRLGAETVTLVYRRGAGEMGATGHEQEIAQLNGVLIRHWARPVTLEAAGGRVAGVTFEHTRLDAGGRLEGTGERFTLAADQVFKAIGQKLLADELAGSGLAIEAGKLRVDDELRTSLDGVWAGGDAVAGQDLTVAAVEDGKRAARSIDRALGN